LRSRTVKPVRSKKKIIALVLSLCAAASVMMYTVTVKTSNKPLDYRAQFEKCFALGGEESKDASIDCTVQVYAAASERGEMPLIINTLSEIADQNRQPLNFRICHTAAHVFGPIAVENLGGVLPAIDVLSTPVCGFVHGPYDIFGRESHTFDEWREMVTLCDRQKNKQSDLQCADALGHALSQSVMSRGTNFEEWLFSIEVCAEFSGSGGRIDCGEALLMERYGPLDPTLEPEEAPSLEELTASCRKLPVGVLDGQEGCASGIGWYLSENVNAAFRTTSLENGSGELSRRFEEQGKQVREICDMLGEDLAGYCMRRYSSLMNVFIAQDPEMLTLYCSSNALTGVERDCFFSVRARLDLAARAKVAELNPEFVPDYADPNVAVIYPSLPAPELRNPQ